MNNSTPYIPEMITVHIGTPDEEAKNITIPFPEYIMNVASSSLNPNWPENLLVANIYNIVSIALSRIYNDYYRSRGYNFDITDSETPGYQYVDGHVIFNNIRSLVGNTYNNYLTVEGTEPFYGAGNNGVNELTGEEALNIAGQTPEPLDILKKIFGSEIGIVENTPLENSKMNPPAGLPFKFNCSGNDVRNIQIELNRISTNYPTIPKIPITDGIFLYETEEAVQEFQRIFGLPETGFVDQATWNEIFMVYSSISRQQMLNTKVTTDDMVSQQFPGLLSLGSSGSGVMNLQYYINFLSQYYRSIPPVVKDGIYGDETLAAVADMQRTLGLNPSGVVDQETWDRMYDSYLGIINKMPNEYINGNPAPYAGSILRPGMNNDQVKIIQEYLNYIADKYPEIPHEPTTGYFGTLTNQAVLAVQRLLGLSSTGYIDEATWDAITELYTDIYYGTVLSEGQYPGFDIGEEGEGSYWLVESDAVMLIQKYLNAFALTDPDFEKVPVDGIYDTATRNAVIVFQKKAGLDPTGIVDRETWDMLYGAYKEDQKKCSPLTFVCPFLSHPSDYVVKSGDTGFLVSAIQYLLQEISIDFDFKPTVTVTGTYDEATESAVKVFQERNMLPVTGKVDRETWNRLADYYNTTKNEYSQ